VYVFTPRGQIMAMPRGATAVDFAYAVHTDIGNRCVAVKINQELMPLRTELKNGDRVEVITAAHAKPNPLWLNFVVTGKSRSAIRHFLKTMHFQESVQLGERLLNQALANFKAHPSTITELQWEKLVRESNAKSRQEILSDIGLGKRLSAVVARKLLALGEAPLVETAAASSVVIHGSEGMAVQFARCCKPIPGDPIMGMISKGQGMVIHTHDCPSVARTRIDPERLLDVAWAPETRKLFEVSIKLVVANRRGVLAHVAAEIAEAGSNIQNVSVTPGDDGTYTDMLFTLQVSNRLHLARILRALRRIPEVVRINRVKG
jgi:GTP pyrophosphokinase